MSQATMNEKSARPSRHDAVLDAAAELFCKKGYDGASVRDIATATGMLPGSIYCHFSSKEDLFLAVQREGIRHLTEAVHEAIDGVDDPWDRLHVACVAHLNEILNESDYAAVLVQVTPVRNLDVWEQLIELRDAYENVLCLLVDALPLPGDINRKYFRLALLGALNWTHTWYRQGSDDPEEIATQIIRLLKSDLGRPVQEQS